MFISSKYYKVFKPLLPFMMLFAVDKYIIILLLSKTRYFISFAGANTTAVLAFAMQLVNMEMPFGKYKGRLLCSLPVVYLEWFKRKGKLGVLLETMFEIKMNGLEQLLEPLKKK